MAENQGSPEPLDEAMDAMTREVRSRIVALPAAEVRRRGRQRHQRRMASLTLSAVVALGVLASAAYAGLADESGGLVGPATPVATSTGSSDLYDLLPAPAFTAGPYPTTVPSPGGPVATGFLPPDALPDVGGEGAWRPGYSADESSEGESSFQCQGIAVSSTAAGGRAVVQTYRKGSSQGTKELVAVFPNEALAMTAFRAVSGSIDACSSEQSPAKVTEYSKAADSRSVAIAISSQEHPDEQELLQYVSLQRSGQYLVLLTAAPAEQKMSPQATDPWAQAMPEAVRLAVRQGARLSDETTS